ncbi:MAG: hypothetical protein M3083_13850 [Actinomycetota bacterium]|nr:hypothetical protein [Actinomycetota bacterium]
MLATILEGVAGEAVNVIATVGAGTVEALTPQPAHVRLVAYSPLSQLRGTVDGRHPGGHVDPQRPQRAGLPLLVLPQGADQFHNAP